jgi:hypothetical protein
MTFTTGLEIKRWEGWFVSVPTNIYLRLNSHVGLVCYLPTFSWKIGWKMLVWKPIEPIEIF